MPEGLKPYESELDDSKKRRVGPKFDLKRFSRELGLGLGMGALFAGGLPEARAAQLSPAQEGLMLERGNRIVAIQAIAERFFPEQLTKNPDGTISFDGQVDMDANLKTAIENSPILAKQVEEAKAKNEQSWQKIQQIISERSGLIDKMEGFSDEEKEAMKQEAALAIATTYRLTGHKVPEGDFVTVGNQKINSVDTTGELAYTTSELTGGLSDNVGKLPYEGRAQFLGGVNRSLVEAGFIGAVDLVKQGKQ